MNIAMKNAESTAKTMEYWADNTEFWSRSRQPILAVHLTPIAAAKSELQ